MIDNNELELAWNFVEKTDRNIFLTGKAGTGKTTFLHKIKNESHKRSIIVAPTGVAAINAKGVTIHSFFQLSFGPTIPNLGVDMPEKPDATKFAKKFNRKKIEIIKTLDILIIDEISMVRADLLDAIDDVLRKYRAKDKVFGGVQVLMIGDLQQLSPVVKKEEWSILQQFYKTAYFFSSNSFKIANAINIELKHIYRQKNEAFINILNQIRNNNISDESLNELNKRYIPNFKPLNSEGYITLTTHNEQSNKINIDKLESLSSETETFEAQITGDFPEYLYPNHFELHLKKGAQVMFIKNDSSYEKRFYNGKIGKVVGFQENQVIVKCVDDDFDIFTEPETWENINFSINDETKEIEEQVKGKFSQIPLRLAWAITIHKSQGLTFEKAIIDVSGSFAHGQTYVALSRCKTLEGIVLKSPIEKSSIISDEKVGAFTKIVEENIPNKKDLAESEKQYELNLIAELFNYKPLEFFIYKLNKIIWQNKNILTGDFEEHLKTVKDKNVAELIKIADKFNTQLAEIVGNTEILNENDNFKLRISKALEYFIKFTKEQIEVNIDKISVFTDNKAVESEINSTFNSIKEFIVQKQYCLNGLNGVFSISEYLKLRTLAVFQNVEKVANKMESIPTNNRSLFIQLQEFRTKIAKENNLPAFTVFKQTTLFELCEKLPTNTKQLSKIKGFGKIRVAKYGNQMLEIIHNYRINNFIDIVDEPEEIELPKIKKINTREISFLQFKEGKSIAEIAKNRALVTDTILSHLASYVLLGELKVTDVISTEKYYAIKSGINKIKSENLSEIRSYLDNKYSFSEIKIVLSSMFFEDKINKKGG